MRPEILAPAGDMDSLAAALSAGADAVYFGLDEGLNARARAKNFSVTRLAEIADQVHRAGARAYVTLNTVVFEHELPVVEQLIRAAAEAGIDALIVQDPAVVRLARGIAPTLEVHASTQMTVSSPLSARFAADLGVCRIVVPRELSVDQIAQFASESPVPLEVFVHGALCMSWSGQCLTSEAWGGRSANRGQCAQSCRLPYTLVIDGETKDTGDLKYLLSPLDLAAIDHIPDLVKAGVASLKIEGRLKGPAYVHTAVAAYRDRIDGRSTDLSAAALAYTRGFSPGFLGGTDHQALVEGRFPKHRGALLGRVAEITDDRVRVVRQARPFARPLDVEPTAGMGVGFDTGEPEGNEPGGPLFGVEATHSGWWLRFGRPTSGRRSTPGPDLSRVAKGDRVWLSGDPKLDRSAAALAEPQGRIPVRLEARGIEGGPLVVTLSTDRARVSDATPSSLIPAERGGIDEARVRSKLGALGGTPFSTDALIADIGPGLFVPPSELKALRRRLVAKLEAEHLEAYRHAVASAPVAPTLLTEPRAAAETDDSEPPAPVVLVPLCRTEAQLDAVIASGLRYVELDWMERVGLGRAVTRAREAGLAVGVATTRVQKPGEDGIDAHTERLLPDAVLVRHWGGLEYFRTLPAERRPAVHGDFSLNVTNSVTAHHLLNRGCETVTAAHDLDERQLMAMLARVPAHRVAVTVHHHIPTFHTEHCVYAHMLSEGTDYKTCGRPCEQHRVALRDQTGLDHPVIVDVECRNTVFEARAQCAARVAPRLIEMGVRRLRVEFVWETEAQSAEVLAAWSDLLAGKITTKALLSRVSAHEQFGVTAGTMRVLQPA